MENVGKILLSREDIERRVAQIGAEIEKDYAGKIPVAICILNGAMVFFGDLVRRINLPLTFDTMAVSSYGAGTSSSGKINIIKNTDRDVAGKDVLIIEDIIDSGLTMKTLTQILKSRGAKSVKVCAFLDKPSGRSTEFNADYIGYVIGDEFVVGYGLDYDGKYRNLPYVATFSLDKGEKN
ncbi:MAG: hypoxanthine phosphoribosyltransferase [Clostridia bacterium]|nr:hypoxanthine phosphoribosyltransferase [Clostridia bacterium]MDE7215362.1 hypoxanthine phosphoribosyltransferase [Clostridia bacterium]